MKIEYQATFSIDCGVSPGLCVKIPDYAKEERIILADSPQEARQKAMGLAGEFADNYLISPETGLTTVQLLSLRSPDGDVPLDVSRSVVKRSTLDHLCSLLS